MAEEALCMAVVGKLNELVGAVEMHKAFFDKPNPKTILSAVISKAREASKDITQLSRATKDPTLKQAWSEVSDKLQVLADAIGQGLFRNSAEVFAQVRFSVTALQKTIRPEYRACVAQIAGLMEKLHSKSA